MGLTPEEIAHRAFTPSVDGYHQGEVRSFLERVASQLRGLQGALPDGRAELAELTTTLQDHEPRLAGLQQQLASVLAELHAATEQMNEAQRETAAQLTIAKQLAEDQRLAADSAQAQRDTSAKITSEQQDILERLRAEQQAMSTQLAVAQKLALQQADAAEHLAIAGEQSVAQIEAAQALTTQATTAAQQIDSAATRATAASLAAEAAASALPSAPADRPAPQSPTATSAASSPGSSRGYTDPVDGSLHQQANSPSATAPPTSSVTPGALLGSPTGDTATGQTPSGDPLALFASDLDDEPLFSDSANDLLDGVLDDVMENLNDEGNPQS